MGWMSGTEQPKLRDGIEEFTFLRGTQEMASSSENAALHTGYIGIERRTEVT